MAAYSVERGSSKRHFTSEKFRALLGGAYHNSRAALLGWQMTTSETPRRPLRRPRRDAPEATVETPPPVVLAVTATTPAKASRAAAIDRTPAVLPPAPREPTDFAGLQAIADLDRSEIRAAMDAAMGASNGRSFKAGQRVIGHISTLSMQNVFVDIGGKSDAVIDRLELGNVHVGDRLDAFVASTDGGEIRLTRTPSGSAAREMLQEAMASKLELEGKVSVAADSGWQVALTDGLRGFCPASHTSVSEVADQEHVGKSYQFHIQELRGADVVLTRRAIVDAQEREAEAERMGAVREGDVFDAVVVSLRDFGAFVKLSNGVEGMVHVSNIAAARPKHPSEVLKEGDAVRVRVLGIDRERRRVDLGIRQAVEMAATSQTGPRSPAPSRGFNVFAGLLGDVKVRK